MYNESKYTVMTCLIQITATNSHSTTALPSSTTPPTEYIIDVLAHGVWEKVSLLQPLFADPSIVKIGHGIGGMDTSSLHRDFGIFIVNAFDTLEAANVLRLPHKNLAAVCRHYFNSYDNDDTTTTTHYQNLKARYQAADWRRRPLTEPMIKYARYDIRFLKQLRLLMMEDLIKLDLQNSNNNDNEHVKLALQQTLQKIDQAEGDTDEVADTNVINNNDDGDDQDGHDDKIETTTTTNDQHQQQQPNDPLVLQAKDLRMQPSLMKAITKSQERCLQLWNVVIGSEPITRNHEYTSLVRRSEIGQIQYNASQAILLTKLVDWRYQVATAKTQKQHNSYSCLPGLICPLSLLVLISWKRPTSENELRKIQYFLPGILENKDNGYLNQIIELVQTSVQKDIQNGILTVAKKPKSIDILSDYDLKLAAAEKENIRQTTTPMEEKENVRETIPPMEVGIAIAGVAIVAAFLMMKMKR